MEGNEIKLILEGLNCANCANKIEARVNKLKDVKEAVLNFSTSVITINVENNVEEVIKEVKKIVNKLEPHVKVKDFDEESTNINRNICTEGSCSISDSHEGYSHGHEDGEKSSKFILRIKGFEVKISLIVGIISYIIANLIGDEKLLGIILFVLSYVLIGGEVVLTAVRNILRGEVFDENFLMTVATVGAFLIGEHSEAVGVMLFYQIGELFQGYAVNNSRKSIKSLLDIKAEYANLIVDGIEQKVSPEEVKVGDIIVIKTGERVPLDGQVLEGNSTVDTSALTGESLPKDVEKGDKLLAGCINNSSVIKVKVEKVLAESTVSRILDLVNNSATRKANTEKFITKFAKVYTPIVVLIATLVAIVPPLVINDALFSDWLYRGLLFLVVSCPCALVISIPLGLFAGIGGASRKGVLIKGGNYLEALRDVETVVFDKTGTLTKGTFTVTEINPEGISNDELLKYAAIAESYSNHPIAKSIVSKYNKPIDSKIISDYKEVAGKGIALKIGEDSVLAGNDKLMNLYNIKYSKEEKIGTIINIAINGEYKGNIVIADSLKETSKEAISELKKIGIKNTVMLTGDNRIIAENIGNSIGIDKIYSELLPTDKVEKLEEIINNSNNGKVAFVGDGINDAPVLARADVGIAMGAIGSDAAVEAADIVLMKDDPSDIAKSIRIARKTNKILWQNIILALSIKVIVLILGAFGVATMWEAVFADVGVTLLAVLNSSRCLK